MKNAIAYIKHSLSSFYPPTEIFSFTKIIAEHITGKRFSPLLIDSIQLPSEQQKKIEEIVERLKAKETHPIYIWRNRILFPTILCRQGCINSASRNRGVGRANP